MRLAAGALVVVAASLVAAAAAADPDDARPMHGSVGVGGALLFTGGGDDAQRLDVEADLEPGGRWGRYGVLVALRAFDGSHDGLVCAGLVFDAAVARPKLALQLHADAGVDLDASRPMVGGGLRTTLGVVGPLGVMLDLAGDLIIAGASDTRFAITGDALVVAHF
jgi:hypothetical protein|nr:hypothetical protein [Kofleriaceae bacterium]